MKTLCLAALCLAFSLTGTYAQTANNGANQTVVAPPPTEYRVVDRGSNHRLWQRETYEVGDNGQIFTHVHQYTELASGMCYQQNGQWVDSQDLIEAYSSGAIAQQGPYQVVFANNLNSAGAIDQQTPDNKRLRSNILGLAYYDSSTGQSVMIAQIQDSQGELIAGNEVLYPNALSGVSGDIRYTYKKGSFEQDVILREQPPTPESYGLNSDTTEIEVLTEFLNPPEATTVEHALPNNSLPDQDISWGAMHLGHGKAFDLGEPPNVLPHVTVRRQYFDLDGRHILIEGVPLPKVKSQLSNLPLQSSSTTKFPTYASKTRMLPKSPVTQASVKLGPMKVTSAVPSKAGYVLDYIELHSDQTNFTFYGDTTYYVSAEYDLKGTTTFEGGTVIKLNGSGQIDIDGTGTMVCQTASYRPAIFTSINDNTVGEGISGSTGTPAFDDVFCYLFVNPLNVAVHDLRFSYCVGGIIQGWGAYGAMADVWDCQFKNMDCAVYGFNVGLHNVLIGRSTNEDAAVYIEGPSLVAENVTVDKGNNLVEPDYYGAVIALTNCLVTSQLIVGPGYAYTLLTNSTACLPSPTGPIYQTVGAGSYYLTNGSPYRNAGTTNVNPAMLADIGDKTTYPPIVISGVTLSTVTNFSPQAQRDNIGSPDLGYHYNPLDYVFGNVTGQSNITFTTGTAVGWFYTSSGATHGLVMGDSATTFFTGTVTAPCRWVKYETVQEGGNGNWTAASYVGGLTGQSYTHAPPACRAQFTTFSVTAADAGPYAQSGSSYVLVFAADNCEFYNGGGGGYYTSINVTNCLFVNGAPGIYDNYNLANFTMQGCTCLRGNVEADNTSGTGWPVTIQNCAFDSTTFYMNAHGGATNGYYTDYNSFVSLTNTTLYFGGHELTNVISYNWQSGSLGSYYLTTDSPLVNAGSTNANLLGLYQFTTQTNQVKEADSIVDIGYHYIATDGYGNPLDTDGDGISDYLEDLNGDGIYDAGDLSDWLLSPYNGLSAANGLSVYTPLK